MFDLIIKSVGIVGLTGLLVAFESLQDVYMQMGISSEFRTQLKQKVMALCGVTVDDKTLDLFIDSFVDNSFQKLDLLKAVIWANIGLFLINGLEDKVQEKFNGIKNKVGSSITNFVVNSKFNLKGAKKNIIRDLVVQKNEQVKKASDYMFQATSVGAGLLNATNTGVLYKMHKSNNLGGLMPKSTADYQICKEMLNTVQASR